MAKAHRSLKLGHRGADVRSLQVALNQRLKARGRNTITVDGHYGPRTHDAVLEMAYALGALPSTIQKGATPGVQRMIRDPNGRTTAQKRRAAERKKRHASPKVVKLSVPMEKRFGDRGGWQGLVCHYTAGPRDTSDPHGISLLRGYNLQHRAAGWGAIGYGAAILSSGTIVLLRPAGWKGAHVAGHNTGKIGIVVLGGPGQRMTEAQEASLRWLLANGHTAAMPASHRWPAPPPRVWMHKDLNATTCPGDYAIDYRKAA